MKTLQFFLIAAFITLGSLNVSAQPMKTGTVTPYKASMDGWLVNVQEANALSEKTGLPIMANFTGTDWCGWCIKLRNEVFLTQEFKDWAKDNVILLELDFPRKFQLPADIKTQNYALAQALKVGGYPTIWFFTLTNNDKGEMNINSLGKTGYVPGGPNAYIQKAEQIIKNAN